MVRRKGAWRRQHPIGVGASQGPWNGEISEFCIAEFLKVEILGGILSLKF